MTKVLKFFNDIKDKFKKKDHHQMLDDIKKDSKPHKEFNDYISPKEIQREYKKIIVPEVYSNKDLDDTKSNILIMDDFSGMAQLLLTELDRVQCCNVKKDFNVLLATGIFAAFSVENMLKERKQQIDVAFLDITLGGVIKGKEYDGIDVAIMIKKKFPNCVIKFVTGHTLNRHNPELFKFIEKFENFFKLSIEETEIVKFEENEYEIYKHIINKNGNRVACMGAAVQEFRNL